MKFSLLTAREVLCQIRTKLEHYEAKNLQKENIKPHQSFTGSFNRNIEAVDELQIPRSVKY